MKEELLKQIEELYGISKKNILSVSQVSQYIQDILSGDPKLQQIYVLGEVSNAAEKQGYTYFDIKDEDSLIRCVIFPGNKKNISFKIENGLGILLLFESYARKSI